MTIEDSLRGHFLRTFRRRIAKARGAELSIEVADLQLLLDLVEPLDAEIRELRERPTWTDDPERDASYRISYQNALEAMDRGHPGLLEAAGTLHGAITAAARTQPSMPLMTAIWNDGYSHGCDGCYSPTGDVAKGEPESLVESEVLRVLDAWGRAKQPSADPASFAHVPEADMIVTQKGPTTRFDRVHLPDPATAVSAETASG